MNDSGQRLIGAFAGFLGGIVLWMMVWLLFQGIMELFGSSHARFRVPVVLFVAPLVGAWWGWRFGHILAFDVTSIWTRATRNQRLMAVGPLFWAACVVAYVFVFQPFGGTVSQSEWWSVVKLVLFPTFVIWVGTSIWYYLVKTK